MPDFGSMVSRVAVLSGWAVAVSLALALAGCRQPADPERRPVARIGERALTVVELQAYLALNWLDDGSAPEPGEDRDRVLSRLFDNFIEERLLLEEARRAGVEVSDREVALFAGVETGAGAPREEPAPTGGEPPLARGSPGWEVVRGSLAVQKFRERYLAGAVAVEEAEVSAYLETHAEAFTPEPLVVVRSLMVESPETAARAHREIRRRRITFDEAVVSYASEPGQGLEVEMPPGSLPPEVREAIDDLRPGRVTAPITLHGSTYLFQLVRRTDASADADGARERAREALLRERREQALAELLSELRRASRLETYPKHLTFRYVDP